MERRNDDERAPDRGNVTSDASTHAATDNASPDHEIRRRAYELYQARGAKPGRDMDDWLTAEREVRERAARPAPAAETRNETPREAGGASEQVAAEVSDQPVAATTGGRVRRGGTRGRKEKPERGE